MAPPASARTRWAHRVPSCALPLPVAVAIACAAAWGGFLAGRDSSSFISVCRPCAPAPALRVAPQTALLPPPMPLPHPVASSATLRSACHVRLATRGDLPAHLDALGLSGEGVEVGVRDGDFSLHTLSHWKGGSTLHLVDPWLAQANATYRDVSNVEQAEHDARHDGVVAAMSARFPGRFEIHRTFSVEAAQSFPDASLAYVYLDARHDFEGVSEDLNAWWPKLRMGGLLAGHDFVPDGIIPQGDFGVQGAVLAFARTVGREVLSISDKDAAGGRLEPQHVDGGWTTWWFIK